ncbi:MAG: adenosine kinase, partial [Caulobacteraceae bacterium]
MMLIDEPRAHELYGKMGAASKPRAVRRAIRSPASPAWAGARPYVGKVAADQLGDVFAHDTRQIGVHFETGRLSGGAATGRCLINVTPTASAPCAPS